MKKSNQGGTKQSTKSIFFLKKMRLKHQKILLSRMLLKKWTQISL